MRIDIHTPAEVTEVARALQLANQRRLADRQADGWLERDTRRVLERTRSLVDDPASRRAGSDPWRGAVPEFEPVPEVRARLFGKRFEVAGAYFQWRSDGRLLIWTADREQLTTINLPYAPQWHEVLPAGGDRVMLLFYGFGVDVQYGSEPGFTSYEKVAGAPNALASIDETFEPIVYPPNTNSPFPDGFTANPENVRVLPFPNTFTETTIIETDRQTVEALSFSDYRYAVLVSRRAIRVAQSWPSVLTGVISQKYRVATGAKVVNTTPKIRTTVILEFAAMAADYYNPAGVLFETKYLSGRYDSTIGVPTGAYDEDYEVAYTDNAYHQATLLQFSTPGGPDIFAEWVFYPLMRSYGYGHLVNRDQNGQAQAWGSTPAVFSFIKNYRGEFHKEDGDRMMLTNGMSYQYARDNYFPVDAPQYFLTAGVAMPQAEQDTTGSYYWFEAPPIDESVYFNDPMAFRNDGTTTPGLVLRLNRQPYSKEVVQQAFTTTQEEMEKNRGNYFATGLQIPVAAWDWDRPLACWIELSRFGFTPEDLMLSESEAQALAAADWDEVGFKF